MRAARNLLDVAKRIQGATIFRSQFVAPEELPSLEVAAKRIRELAGPGELRLVDSAAAFPDFDPFLALTVKNAGEFVCFIADRWLDAGDRAAARRILEALL